MSLKVAIRADASPTIGHGHVMRCLTLANKLAASGVTCLFVSVSMPETLAQRIVGDGHSIARSMDDNEVSKHLKRFQPDWLVVDHYEIDQALEQEWASHIAGLKVLVIDDLANRPHHCDILVDITPGREASAYAGLVPETAKLCLGSDYALVADAFTKLRPAVLARREAAVEQPHLLVTLGGGDTSVALETVANALTQVAETCDFSVTVIASDAPKKVFEPLERFEQLSFVNDIDQHMARADYCIGAAGGTTWERCCLGLPTVALQLAENQNDNFEFLKASGAAICVDQNAEQIALQLEHLMRSDEIRRDLVDRSSRVCDGRGASRIRDQILAHSLSLRAATLDDAEFIYEARYAGGMERFYRNPVKPDFSDHVAWLEKALSEDDRSLLVLELAGEAIAHVRFDHKFEAGAGAKSQEAEIGIAIAERNRGTGYGSAILLAACGDYFAKGGRRINAKIGMENRASIQVFENAGFVATGEIRQGMACYALTV